jgi:hypothetical protein
MMKSEAEKRVAEIDAMFEDAKGWGSWMVAAANEREVLANAHGFEHKWLARTVEQTRTQRPANRNY